MGIAEAGISRGALLKGGATLAVSAAGLGSLAGVARAGTLPDGDLAYLRLLIAVELLTQDFSSSTDGLTPAAKALFARVHADDTAHYNGLATVMSTAGQEPATAGDINFSYPKNVSPLTLGWTFKGLSLGAYLGAVENVQTPSLRLPIGQIAANEAQQLSAFAEQLGKPTVGHAFATALSIEAVSTTLGEFES